MQQNGDAPITLGEHCTMDLERQAGTAVVRLSGELDLDSEKRLNEELRRLLEAETEALTIDLRGLEFIDSTGLRMLVQIDATARQDGFDLSFLCGNGQVREVLRLTGLDDVLPLADSSPA